MITSFIIALPEEAEGLKGHSIYLSGCGKVNATIATMEAIDAGAKKIINYGISISLSFTYSFSLFIFYYYSFSSKK